MRKYILMKEPEEPEAYSSQIRIINEAGIIGRQTVERLTAEGWTCAGYIESELSTSQLRDGFSHHSGEAAGLISAYSKRIMELAERL